MTPESFSSLVERYKARRAHELELNRATSAFERAVFQPLFLLNGGASVAVLGLLGAWGARVSAQGIKAVYLGLFCWSVGLVLATVATLFGYFSQRDFTRAEHEKRKRLEQTLTGYVAQMPAPLGGLPEVSPQDPNLTVPGNGKEPSPKPLSPQELVASAKKHQLRWWILVGLSLVFFILGVGATAYGLAQTAPQVAGAAKAGADGAASLDASALASVLDQVSRPAPWVTPFFILAGLGAICGLLMALFGRGNVVRGVGTALAVSSIFGGTAVTFFKDVQVKLPELNLSSSPASTSPQLERIKSVGPFETGKAEVLEDHAVTPIVSIDDALKDLVEKAKRREIAYVLFIGSADKFELLPQLRTQYGSNAGLARARGEWVANQLRAALKGPSFESITLTVGPNMHDLGLSPKDTAADRSVAIYVAWRDRSQEGGIRDWLKSLNTKSEAVEGKR